jgi:Uma2 family endonuclease
VSDSSLDFDRTVKLELYARAGIREVWIVDLTTDGVLVHRRPSGGGYGSVVRVEAPGVLEVEALPGVTIPAAAVFSNDWRAERLSGGDGKAAPRWRVLG